MVCRMYDEERKTVVYTAFSSKIIEGAPMNAPSTVSAMRWDSGVAKAPLERANARSQMVTDSR